MKKIQFENLIESNTSSKNFGKMLEIEVPNDFDEHTSENAKLRGCEFGNRLAMITAAAKNSGNKIREAFGNVNN